MKFNRNKMQNKNAHLKNLAALLALALILAAAGILNRWSAPHLTEMIVPAGSAEDQ